MLNNLMLNYGEGSCSGSPYGDGGGDGVGDGYGDSNLLLYRNGLGEGHGSGCGNGKGGSSICNKEELEAFRRWWK